MTHSLKSHQQQSLPLSYKPRADAAQAHKRIPTDDPLTNHIEYEICTYEEHTSESTHTSKATGESIIGYVAF